MILVLCSYQSVLWDVRPDADAKLERVIIGGHEPQQATGLVAPVSYHVYSSHERGDEPTYFHAFRRNEKNYLRLVDAVRRLTGKEITTFRGRYAYAGGPPFVVGPPLAPEEEEAEDNGEGGTDTITISVGAHFYVVLRTREGSTWDQPPKLAVQDGANAPIRFDGLHDVENADAHFDSTPVLVFPRPNQDPPRQFAPRRPRPAGIKPEKYVYYEFSGLAPGKVTITMTRRSANGEVTRTSQMIVIVR
jgi:hypothetical protein